MRYPHLTHPPLVAIAHGSRDPQAGATVTGLLDVARERAAGSGLAGLDIRAAFLDHAAPAPVQVLSALGDGPVIVLPLLLTAAYHSGTDIPGLLAGAQAGAARAADPLRLAAGAAPGAAAGAGAAAGRGGPGPGPGRADRGGARAAGSSHPAANAVIAGLAARWQASRGWLAVRPAYASAAGLPRSRRWPG